MHPLSRIFTSLSVVLMGLAFVPMASALPISSTVNGLRNIQTNQALALADESRLDGLVKKAGYGIHLGYGGYGGYGLYGGYGYGGYGHYYPRSYGYGSYSYYPYDDYTYYRPYKYKKYRSKRRYKKRQSRKHYRRHRRNHRH